MTVEGPRDFSAANGTPSSAQIALQVLSLFEHSLKLGGATRKKSSK